MSFGSFIFVSIKRAYFKKQFVRAQIVFGCETEETDPGTPSPPGKFALHGQLTAQVYRLNQRGCKQNRQEIRKRRRTDRRTKGISKLLAATREFAAALERVMFDFSDPVYTCRVIFSTRRREKYWISLFHWKPFSSWKQRLLIRPLLILFCFFYPKNAHFDISQTIFFF